MNIVAFICGIVAMVCFFCEFVGVNARRPVAWLPLGLIFFVGMVMAEWTIGHHTIHS